MAKRILLFTGKGGVGKTTCAAATAVRAAQSGLKTLVLSSDPAHSLADALGVELGAEPQEVAPKLFAQEVDQYYSMKKYWGNLRNVLRTVFRWQGVEGLAAEELASLPGMAEASVLLWIDLFHHEADYDLIVVDSAPTGETLTLLSLPQITQWWISKAFPFQKTALKTFGALARSVTGIPVDYGVEELDALFGKLERIQKVLADASITAIRLVANPERMVINEAKRAYAYLQLYGYGVDAVVVNRILPKELGWEKYLAAQTGYLQEITESFQPLPVLRVPHLGEEVFGMERLKTIADGLYGETPPETVFHHESTYRFEQDGEAYVLSIRLPMATQAQMDVRQFGDQLVIQLANQRRNVPLPNFLGYYRCASWALEDGWLRIRFVA